MEWRAAYLITWTCYGERVHGDERGSVSRGRHGRPSQLNDPDSDREARERHLMEGEPQTLDGPRRRITAETVAQVCEFKHWQLYAVNARTNHVHVVVWAPAPANSVMRTFKSWTTRRLREAGLLGAHEDIWARHGSTPHLWNDQDIADAVSYVVDGQGTDLGGLILGNHR